MVHEALLNAYVFDFLKKKGFLQTALLFADECKDLPLAETTSDDPLVSMPSSLAPKNDTLLDPPVSAVLAAKSNSAKPGDKSNSVGSDSKGSLSPASTLPSNTAAKAEKAGDARSLTASPQTQHRVPSVNIPINTPNGFLVEWWSIFWDVFAATSERRPGALIAEGIREYVQYQNQGGSRRPSSAEALNVNGKRHQSHSTGNSREASTGAERTDGMQGAKRARANPERSPQSAALVAKYSLSDDIDSIRLGADQHRSNAAANGLHTNGVPTIPRGPGVNISPAGAHVLSEDYTGFLSRSFKMVAENHTSSAATAAAQQPSASTAVSTEGNTHNSNGLYLSLQQQQQQANHPNTSRSEPNATGAQQKDRSSESPLSQDTNILPNQNANNKPGSTFASPHFSNASIARTVPTQQHVGANHMGSPLVPSSSAAAAAITAGNIQIIQRLISPPPASYGAHPQQQQHHSLIGSPVASNAPAMHPDLRRSSTASVLYRTPQQPQQQNASPLVHASGLPRMGSVGPQAGAAQRQQQIPSNFTAGMVTQAMQASAINPADFAFHSSPATIASAAAAAAAAGNFNGRNPTQAMMAYLQQHNQMGVPSNDTMSGNRPNQQQQQQQMQFQLNAAQFGQQFIHVPGMAMSAASENHQIANVAGAMQDQNQRYMLQLQMQMQQGSNPGTQSGQGNNSSPAQIPGEMPSVGAANNKSGNGAESASKVASGIVRQNSVPFASSQANPQQQSTASTPPANTKKPAAKPKAKRASKKTAKNTPGTAIAGASPVVSAAINADAIAAKKALAASGNDSAPNPNQKGGPVAANTGATEDMSPPYSAIPSSTGLGASSSSVTGNNNNIKSNNSGGTSMAGSSPALTIKASSKAANGVIIPATNTTANLPNANTGGAGASTSFPANTNTNTLPLDLNASQTESDMQASGMTGFGDNAFSALLSQKGNRVTMQGNNAGGSSLPPSSGADLASAINSIGSVGGMDANDLSLHISEWLNESSTDTLTSILGMGVTMGDGADNSNGNSGHANNNSAGNDGQVLSAYGNIGDSAAAAAAAFSSFITNSGSAGNGVGGFSSALSMPIGGIGTSLASIGSNKGEKSNSGGMVFSPATASGNQNM
ncbi:hypothetical protein BX070DRAFT_237152 [Coemansia spiralis]|nr:hypothetical protein BX070DRAFT_237152 [Coemansia spiralis]